MVAVGMVRVRMVSVGMVPASRIMLPRDNKVFERFI